MAKYSILYGNGMYYQRNNGTQVYCVGKRKYELEISII